MVLLRMKSVAVAQFRELCGESDQFHLDLRDTFEIDSTLSIARFTVNRNLPKPLEKNVVMSNRSELQWLCGITNHLHFLLLKVFPTIYGFYFTDLTFQFKHNYM